MLLSPFFYIYLALKIINPHYNLNRQTDRHTPTQSYSVVWKQIEWNLIRWHTHPGLSPLLLASKSRGNFKLTIFYHLTLSVKMLCKNYIPAVLKSFCIPVKVFVQKMFQLCLFSLLPGTEGEGRLPSAS